MFNISILRLAQRRNTTDWKLLRGSAKFSIGRALASFLAFVFMLVVAKNFSPAEFGSIQYAISVAMLVSIITQPFGQHVLARFVGKYKEDAAQLLLVVSNAWFVLAALTALTLLLAGPVLAGIDLPYLGILAIVLGITLFYAYWGLAGGFSASSRLTLAYVGGNVLQLILVLFVIYILDTRSSLLVLIVYGLCFILPPIVLQLLWPLPIRFEVSSVRRNVSANLLRFSLPIWVSHGCYILSQTIDIILLGHYWGPATVGVYAVGKLLASVSLFFPSSLATFLMPKVAGLPRQDHRQLLTRMLFLSMIPCIGILIAYLLLGKWFIQTTLGPEYDLDLSVAILLALGMVITGSHSVATAVFVGSGRPGVETIGRVVGVGCALLVGLFLIPAYGPLGAAVTVLAGPLSGMLTYVAIGLKETGNSRLLEADS